MSDSKKIHWAIWTLSIAGLISEIVPLFNLPRELNGVLGYLVPSLGLVNFFIIAVRDIIYFNSHNGLVANFLNLLFYFLFFAGAIFYQRSRGKEVRLLRFCFAVLLICSCSYFISGILALFRPAYIQPKLIFWFFVVIGFIKSVGLAYVSWWVLNKLTATRTLASVAYEETKVYVAASRWHRFFHLVVDGILILVIFSPFLYFLGEDNLRVLESEFGARAIMAVFFIVFRLIYHPFFEALLGATPAKLFSETRVLTEDGDPISFRTSLARTFARFIPFETLSFFGAQGWHDQISRTQVIKEERLGVSGKKYLLAIPVVLVLAVVGYFAKEEIEHYQFFLSQKKYHDKKIAAIERELSHLTPDHFIKLEGSNGKDPFLKIEETGKDEVFVSVIDIEEYGVTKVGVGSYYDQNHSMLMKLTLKMSDLNKAYTKEYEDYDDYRRSYAKLLQDDVDFEIDEIFVKDVPALTLRSHARGDDEIYLEFENSGWEATLTEISNVDGAVVWDTQLPIVVPGAVQKHSRPSFTINGTGFKRNAEHKVHITLADRLGRPHQFMVVFDDEACAITAID